MSAFSPPCLFNDYLSTGEAICCCPEEGSKKPSRKPVYEVWSFWNRDVVEIGMAVVLISFRLDYLRPSSGKLQIAAPESSSRQIAKVGQTPPYFLFGHRDW